MMKTAGDNTDDLQGLVQQRITALVLEMEDAGWSAEDIALAIKAVVDVQWLQKAQALRQAGEVGSDDFVSDGNEG